MKTAQFLRKLEKEGCTIIKASKHIRIEMTHKNRQKPNVAYFPHHVSKEIHRGLAKTVLKNLDLVGVVNI